MASDSNYTIQQLPDDERPRERLLAQGAAALSTTELLAIILRSGTTRENALQLAGRILAQYEGLPGLVRVSAAELTQLHGLGRAKAAQIVAALELGRRAGAVQGEKRPRITNAAVAAQLVQDMSHLTQEQVRVILLDSARQLLAIHTVYIGTVNTSVLRISEIYREAITRNSPAIILAHNHPSGDPSPSPEDVELTRAMVAAGELLDIHFVDHLIIGRDGWRSLREMQLGFSD